MDVQAPQYAPNAPVPRPYVSFERRSREVRTKDGEPTYVDTDIVTLIAPGARDSTELEVADWLEKLRDHAKNNRVPNFWPSEYAEAYRLWKETQEQPVHGTSIKNWPPISAAQRESCLKANVLTIEDLANASDEALGRIGMGAMKLKQMAAFWLKEQSGAGKGTAQLNALLVKTEEQSRQIAQLMETNAALQAQLAATVPTATKE